jgi:hypothetical protein
MKTNSHLKQISRLFLIAAALVLAATSSLFAQGLNWEGQTGAFVTPFAYASSSPKNGIGRPNVAFHYLNGGSVVGNDFETSITVGLFKYAEIGYTRASNASGTTPGLSPLFENGFNIFHGKVNVLPENSFSTKYLPAIAVGFVARTNVKRVGGVITDKETNNGDFYLVATKTITQTKTVPILVNFGVKETDASLLGIAGNAPAWGPRLFGAAGFVLPGPSKSKVVVGSEFLQEPHHIQNLPGATLPTTLTYFARVIPIPERPFNLDFGVAQAAGEVLPGAKVNARAQFAFGATYRF